MMSYIKNMVGRDVLYTSVFFYFIKTTTRNLTIFVSNILIQMANENIIIIILCCSKRETKKKVLYFMY